MKKNIIPITGNVTSQEREERLHDACIAWQIFSKPEAMLAWVAKEPNGSHFAFCIARDTTEFDGWFVPLVHTQYLYPNYETAADAVKRTLLLVLKRYSDKKEDKMFLTTKTVEWVMDEIYSHKIAKTSGTPLAREAEEVFASFLKSYI